MRKHSFPAIARELVPACLRCPRCCRPLQATEAIDGEFDEASDVFILAHVGAEVLRLNPERAKLIRQALALCVVDRRYSFMRRTISLEIEIGTQEQWLKARLELLEAEKELICRSDELARRRRQLPWVRIDNEYVVDTDEGEQTLCDLLAGRSQRLPDHHDLRRGSGPGSPPAAATANLPR
jgi:hypothetical protein